MWENSFQNQFWTLWSALPRKPAHSLSCVFGLGHFPKSKIDFESSFLIKCYIITIVKKMFGAFWSIIKEVKKCIYHCKSKMWFCPGKGFFHKKILKKPKSLEYPLELGLGGSEARFSFGHLPPPLNKRLILVQILHQVSQGTPTHQSTNAEKPLSQLKNKVALKWFFICIALPI